MENKIKIHKIHEIDLDRLEFSKPKTSDIPIVYTLYNDPESGRIPLIFQTPEMYLSSDIVDLNYKFVTHELILSLIGKTVRTTKAIRQFFEGLDDKIFNSGKKNKDEWPFSDNDIKYKSLIRYLDDDDPSSGVLKIKILRSKTFTTKIFDENREIIRSSRYNTEIKEGCYCKLILECVSAWINGDVFGLYLRPHQIRVSKSTEPPLLILDTYSFDDEDVFDKASEKEISEKESRNDNNSETSDDIESLQFTSSSGEVMYDSSSGEVMYDGSECSY